MNTITITIGQHIGQTNVRLPRAAVEALAMDAESIVAENTLGYTIEPGYLSGAEPTLVVYAYPNSAASDIDTIGLKADLTALARGWGQGAIALTIGETSLIGPNTKPWEV